MLANARDSLRLPRLVAGHFTDNPASGRVLQKLGFRPTGITRGRYSAGRGGIAPAMEFVLDMAAADRTSGPRDGGLSLPPRPASGEEVSLDLNHG